MQWSRSRDRLASRYLCWDLHTISEKYWAYGCHCSPVNRCTSQWWQNTTCSIAELARLHSKTPYCFWYPVVGSGEWPIFLLLPTSDSLLPLFHTTVYRRQKMFHFVSLFFLLPLFVQCQQHTVLCMFPSYGPSLETTFLILLEHVFGTHRCHCHAIVPLNLSWTKAKAG